MNSEWELNIKSEKQLYLTCITFINDYDVEIWWNNQKSYLVKFRKLQNAALRKILNAFWTLSINAMQIKVEISSMKMQLNQKCKNYAIWIVELLKKHFIRKRTFISYSSQYFIKLNLFFFFIKCMQSMTMTLSRRCVYAKLHVIWSKLLLYIFSLINHIDSLHIQALSLKFLHLYFRFSLFLCTFRVLLFRF